MVKAESSLAFIHLEDELSLWLYCGVNDDVAYYYSK